MPESRPLRHWSADQLRPGVAQTRVQVQALKPSRSGSGAEGTPITLPLESIRSMAWAALRWAGLPLTEARSNAGEESRGRDGDPAFAPRISGVSSIHSALSWVEVYETRMLRELPLVRSWSVIFHTSDAGRISTIDACMRSPGRILIAIDTDGPGITSHQAE